MNQAEIGAFMKTLRKEKGLTQEQLAEKLCVNRRTVSRWETGSNLPDLDLLVEMSDFYGVTLRELLIGVRESGEVSQQEGDTARKVAEYSSECSQKITRRMHGLFICGLLAATLYMILLFTGYDDNFLGGLCLGITFGMMIMGVIITSKNAVKIREWKLRLSEQNSPDI